jgi:hypothetical protein
VKASVEKIPPPLRQIQGDQRRIAAGASAERKSVYHELVRVVGQLGRVGHEIVASERSVVKPLDLLHQDNVRIAGEAARQRDAQLRATEHGNVLLTRIATRRAELPGYDKQPKGKGSKDARAAARAGNRG